MFSDLKWRLLYLVTGERPAPRTTSTERVNIFKELRRSGMDANGAWMAVADIVSDESQNPSPPWA